MPNPTASLWAPQSTANVDNHPPQAQTHSKVHVFPTATPANARSRKSRSDSDSHVLPAPSAVPSICPFSYVLHFWQSYSPAKPPANRCKVCNNLEIRKFLLLAFSDKCANLCKVCNDLTTKEKSLKTDKSNISPRNEMLMIRRVSTSDKPQGYFRRSFLVEDYIVEDNMQ